MSDQEAEFRAGHEEQQEDQQEDQQPNAQLSIIKRNVTSMKKMLDEFKVTSDEELSLVAGKIASIMKLKKQVKEAQDSYMKPAKQIIAKAKEDYDWIIDECDSARKILDGRAIAYHNAQEAKRRAEEEKIAKKVEAGRMKPETAVAKMETLTTPSKTVSSDNGSTLSFTVRKVPRIVNPDIIPEEFWIIDEVRVRREALARMTAGVEQIPGVVIDEVKSTNSRV